MIVIAFVLAAIIKQDQRLCGEDLLYTFIIFMISRSFLWLITFPSCCFGMITCRPSFAFCAHLCYLPVNFGVAIYICHFSRYRIYACKDNDPSSIEYHAFAVIYADSIITIIISFFVAILGCCAVVNSTVAGICCRIFNGRNKHK